MALSLATLFFLSSWWVLLNPEHFTYYHLSFNPSRFEIAGLLIDILLLSLLFLLVARFALSFRSDTIRKVLCCVLVASLFVPLNSLCADDGKFSLRDVIFANRIITILLVFVAISLAVILWRKAERLSSYAQVLLIVLSPLFLVNVVTVASMARHSSPPASFADNAPTALPNHSLRGPQVVWIIFDELDQNLAFDRRPTGLALPEFDRLLQQSISSAHAYPPGADTIYSIPSLTIGTLLRGAVPAGADDLSLTLANGSLQRWSTQSSLFSDTRRAGLTAGIAGWYHPYCRVLRKDLDRCYWVSGATLVDSASDKNTLSASMRKWFELTAYRIPFVYRLVEGLRAREQRVEHIAQFNTLSSDAQRILDDNLDLTLLHFPIPHAPWIFDRHRQELSSQPDNSYLDNLALADRALGEVRSRLESTGRWDNTIVLVTADHWWRSSPLVNGHRDHRIPFILKLAGQQSAERYDSTFNTIVTRALLMQLLKGQITKPGEVLSWLTHNTEIAESPFTSQLP